MRVLTEGVSTLTRPQDTAMTDTQLTIGTTYAAWLHGLAPGWTLHGTATVWEVATSPDRTTVLLELRSDPSPHRVAGPTHYARGTVSVLPDGSRHVESLLTPQPGPSSIGLGWTPQREHNPDLASHHAERAVSALTPWAPLPEGDSPLGVSALPWLERAAADAALATAATRHRDHLIRRLRAGGIPRDTIAQAVDLDPSRITQITTSKSTARAA